MKEVGGLFWRVRWNTFLNLNKTGARIIEEKWDRTLLKQNGRTFS